MTGVDGVSIPRAARDNGATLECIVELDDPMPEGLNITIRWVRNGTELHNSSKHEINATVPGLSQMRVTKIGTVRFCIRLSFAIRPNANYGCVSMLIGVEARMRVSVRVREP